MRDCSGGPLALDEFVLGTRIAYKTAKEYIDAVKKAPVFQDGREGRSRGQIITVHWNRRGTQIYLCDVKGAATWRQPGREAVDSR